MTESRTIFLVGFMGSGKTTIGRALADRIARDFIDLDQMIVDRAGISIPEIFSNFGEDHFRVLEREALRSLSNCSPAVVALGGGAFISEENRKIIAEQGTSIWLDCSLDKILERLGSDTTRPLFANRTQEQLAELLASRTAAYSQADLHIDVTELSIEEAVEQVIRKV
jgi:shikimate kinase